MKMPNLFLFLSATVVAQATALTYNCTLTHEVIPNNGSSGTITSQSAVFDPAKGMYVEMAVPLPDGIAVASLDVDKTQSKLKINMGDYCGERYLETETPVHLGGPIHSIYSYGRNPETGDNWRRLILDCVKAN